MPLVSFSFCSIACRNGACRGGCVGRVALGWAAAPSAAIEKERRRRAAGPPLRPAVPAVAGLRTCRGWPLFLLRPARLRAAAAGRRCHPRGGRCLGDARLAASSVWLPTARTWGPGRGANELLVANVRLAVCLSCISAAVNAFSPLPFSVYCSNVYVRLALVAGWLPWWPLFSVRGHVTRATAAQATATVRRLVSVAGAPPYLVGGNVSPTGCVGVSP